MSKLSTTCGTEHPSGGLNGIARLSVGDFLVLGLLLWGLPGVVVAGHTAAVISIAIALPTWLLTRNSSALAPRPALGRTAEVRVITFAATYFLIDALFGRKLFERNMFLQGEVAVERAIDAVNQLGSSGRGVVELIAAILALLPLALIDVSSTTTVKMKYLLWSLASIMIFYQTSIGRGFLLMAVVAILLGKTSNWRRITAGLLVATLAFSLASYYRGDFDRVSFSNPVVDGVAVPYINLALMLNSSCGSAPWYYYIAEFAKKFVPAFLWPKQIFSFNVEMTLCVYPFLGNDVESVSVFTYLGEYFYYTPALLTAICGGTILGVLARIADKYLLQSRLIATRTFLGLLCVYALRSRVQDVMTILVSSILFLITWRLLVGWKATVMVPQPLPSAELL